MPLHVVITFSNGCWLEADKPNHTMESQLMQRDVFLRCHRLPLAKVSSIIDAYRLVR